MSPKSWHLIVLIGSLTYILFNLWEIVTINSHWNPLLPEYAYFYAIKNQFSFVICFTPVYLTGIILFLLRKHWISIVMLLIWLKVCLLLQGHLDMHQFFFEKTVFRFHFLPFFQGFSSSTCLLTQL
jgi:hypothetical protein